MPDILTTGDLLRVTGYQRAADVERCLRAQKVQFFWGKDGPWTTIALVNAAGGLKPPASNDSAEPYPAAIL